MDERTETKARPFERVTIKPRHRGARPVRALRLNQDRHFNGVTYQLVLIPYTPAELAGRRRAKTCSVAPLMPDKITPPKDEFDWHYSDRPSRMEVDPRAHRQWVRADRLTRSPEEVSAWAA